MSAAPHMMAAAMPANSQNDGGSSDSVQMARPNTHP